MCEEFTILLSSSTPSIPFFLCASRSPPYPADLAFSSPVFISLLLFSSSSFPPIYCIFVSPAFEQLAFHRSSLYPSSFSASLFSPLIPYPLFLARFISAQCQFEFGTWTTGQRVSTKNQFLNARLFRAEEPVCIFPSLLFPYFFMPLYYIRQDAISKHRLADVRIRDQ